MQDVTRNQTENEYTNIMSSFAMYERKGRECLYLEKFD